MRMPGFSGEASLYRSEAYCFVSMNMNSDSLQVVPAEYGIQFPSSGIFSESDIKGKILGKFIKRDCCRYEWECKDGYEIKNGLKFPTKICFMVPTECKKIGIGSPCPTGYLDFSLPTHGLKT